MRLLPVIAAGLMTLHAASVQAAAPTRIQARYDVSDSGLKVAVIDETFIRNGDHYHIESVTRPYGLLALLKHEVIRVSSDGTITPAGLKPQVFDTTRKQDADRNAHAEFDWTKATITLTDRNGTRTLPLRNGTQDRLSAMYQFMFVPLQHAKWLKFDMTNGSKVDDYSYQITPGIKVKVPLGTFHSYYLASPKEKTPHRTEIWLATGRGNFPCKMIVTESNGDRYTQDLTLLNIEP